MYFETMPNLNGEKRATLTALEQHSSEDDATYRDRLRQAMPPDFMAAKLADIAENGTVREQTRALAIAGKFMGLESVVHEHRIEIRQTRQRTFMRTTEADSPVLPSDGAESLPEPDSEQDSEG